MSLFNELKASLEEAVAIQQQRQPAARVTRYEVADVKAIRAALNVSQQEMAEALATSVDTTKSWETRRRNPTGLAAKVLDITEKRPGQWLIKIEATLEIEGQDKPAYIAESLSLCFV